MPSNWDINLIILLAYYFSKNHIGKRIGNVEVFITSNEQNRKMEDSNNI